MFPISIISATRFNKSINHPTLWLFIAIYSAQHVHGIKKGFPNIFPFHKKMKDDKFFPFKG